MVHFNRYLLGISCRDMQCKALKLDAICMRNAQPRPCLSQFQLVRVFARPVVTLQRYCRYYLSQRPRTKYAFHAFLALLVYGFLLCFFLSNPFSFHLPTGYLYSSSFFPFLLLGSSLTTAGSSLPGDVMRCDHVQHMEYREIHIGMSCVRFVRVGCFLQVDPS